jgi:glutamate-1-semialdehyde 2,1-aminomutase
MKLLCDEFGNTNPWVIKNPELSEKLKKAYIGGHSNLKFDLSVTPMKTFVDRMEGARVWDLDDNEYIDYMCALGPIIIGHCHPPQRYTDTLPRD